MTNLPAEPRQGLTDEQFRKMIMGVGVLAARSNNAVAKTLAEALKNAANLEDQKKWILLFYKSCFQLLSFMNMGMNSTVPEGEYQAELEKLVKFQPR